MKKGQRRNLRLNPGSKWVLTPVLSIFVLLSLASSLFGQGIVFPHRCPGPMPPIVPCPPPCVRPVPPPRPPCVDLGAPLPVKSISFTTTISTQVAKTRVEQVFINNNDWVAEGTFFFPIPETASIEEFAMWNDGKRVVGELVEREKARQTYSEIVRKLRDPGLLEYVGRNLFQARVFPIAARSEKKIEIIYSQILKAEGGTLRYEYPLGVGHNVLRQPIGTLSGKIEIASNVALKNIYSPTSGVEVNRKGETRATVSFEQSQVNPTQDFDLYYSLSDQEFGLSLLTYREKGKDGFFLALVSPKVDVKQSDTLAKDIVFVLDTSGSMSDEGKITKAREALKFGIRSLHPNDRFNVIHFASEEHVFETGLVPATPGYIERAVDYVSKLSANGGTDINGALLAALKMFASDLRPHFLVFLTDGLPTVGEQNITEILENAKQANKAETRIFTFGVGYDVNTHLLDQLANGNRGVPEYIAPKEDLEVRVSNFFSKVNSPVLANLKLDFGGVKTDDLYPQALPDLFKGSQLVMVGRYTSSGTYSPRLTGEVNGKQREFVFSSQSFPQEKTESDFIPRLWAIRKVGYLLDQIRLHGETKEVKDEIIQLATKYAIVTPYTSFLITEDERREMRAGAGFVGGFMGGRMAKASPAPAATMSVDMNSQSGASAVHTSDTLQQLKVAERVDSPGLRNVKQVRNKIFVLKDGVWTDSEYNPLSKLPVVGIEFGSEEYFKWVTENRELAEYFSVGKNVIVVSGGKVYQVTASK